MLDLSYHLCKDASTSLQRYCYSGDVVMTETYAKRETQTSRGNESDERVRIDTDGCENARQISSGTGTQRFQPDRENSAAGNLLGDAIGGILDQLIDDAEKQLVKSRECIVWYREEAKEYEQKLNNLRKLKELQQQQQQIITAPTLESSNDNSGENLAE